MMTKNRIRKTLFWLIPAALFLFNPNVTVLDPFPDFIGYILLTLALSKIADLNEDLSEARTAFLRMIPIDAAKLLAILWIFGMEAAGERSSSFLLWSFVFAVLELIFLLPAYRHLFDGILHLGDLYESTSVFDCPKHSVSGKSLTERLRRFTLFFVIAKAVLAFLPELADLTNLSYDEQGSMINLYQYIGTMRVLCFLPMLAIGIVWLVRFCRFAARLRGDSLLMTALDRAYEEKVLPNVGTFIGRSVTVSFAAFLLGAVLTLDLRLDHINILPDVLAFVAFLSSFLLLGKKTDFKKGMGFAALSLYGVFCVFSIVMQTIFFHHYTYGSLLRNDQALTLFVVLVAVEAVKAVTFVLVGLSTARTWKCIIAQHTGYVMAQHAHAEVIERHVESVQKELRRTVLYMTVTMAVYAISDVAYEVFAPDVGFISLVNTVCGVIWIATVWKAQSEILSAVKTKYMLE